MQRLHLGAHLRAQLGVEIRERLVEQEDVGLADQRAGERDPLALAAGELRRPAVEQRCAADSAAARRDALAHLALRHVAHSSPKAMFSATVRCGNSA